MGISNIISKLFGTKSDRDLKQLKPILNNILREYSRIDSLSDDDLRNESAAIRAKVLDYVSADEAKVVSIREQLEDVEIAVSDKEKLATELDELIKEIDTKLEEILNQVLPETFAIVKSTARRFKENSVIRVKATQFDRDLSTTHDFVTIKGDITK